MPEETVALPPGFTPGDHDVVIGKGKKFYFHGGNQWLRQVVDDRTAEYSKASTKTEKSFILSSVVDYIRANGRFVRLDNDGGWMLAEELLCREKCSAVFREYVRNAKGGASSSPSPNPNRNRSKSPVRRPAPVRGLSSRGLSSRGLTRGLSAKGLGVKKGDSSQDLIQKLMDANISSKTSRDNLKQMALSMSTGKLELAMKPSRSGQFAAAKKQSFGKLSSSGLGMDFSNAGNRTKGQGNATWGKTKKATTTSSDLRNLLRMNSSPNVMQHMQQQQPGNSLLQPGVNLFSSSPQQPPQGAAAPMDAQLGLGPSTSLRDQIHDFEAGAFDGSMISNTTPLRDDLQDFKLNALKQMDAQINDMFDAKAAFDSTHQHTDCNGGNTNEPWDVNKYSIDASVNDQHASDSNIDVDQLLQMPIVELDPDNVDLGMDASTMSAFGDPQQSLAAM